MSNGYETGMKVRYEPRSQTVIVNFRGRATILPGVFDNERDAVDAGEAHCRHHGWRPAPPRPAPTVTLRTAW